MRMRQLRQPGKNPADPYMTALCYFNALRELGGARRIVEDEVRDRAARYGTQRRRVDPKDSPFADRSIKEPMEITSRVSTDDVARAKQRLDAVFGRDAEPVDVALATNMISVGLDILRLGLMVVQGQPKTAAEYIQATSRIGRDHDRPGLVVVVLNLHKPRDRTHFEQFGQFPPQLLSRRRGDERHALGGARARPRAGGGRGGGGAPPRSEPHARHGGQGAEEPAGDARGGARRHRRARAAECRSRRQRGAGGAGRWAPRCLDRDRGRADRRAATCSAMPNSKSPHRLLHMPLAPEIANLSAAHQRFVAGRSMRDVEPSVALNPRDPQGETIANADDLA